MSSCLKRKSRIHRIKNVNVKIIPKRRHLEKPDNFIRRDLLSSLKPFNIMQALNLSAKYRITKGLITPNSLRYDIASIFGSPILMIAYFYYRLSINVDYLNISYMTVLFIGYLINCFTHITQKHHNVSVVIEINRIHRSLKNHAKFFKNYKLHNWKCVILINSHYFLLISYAAYVYGITKLPWLLTNCCFIIFDINILYAAVYLKLLFQTLKLLRKDLEKSRFSEGYVCDRDLDRMFDIYMGILKAYRLIQKAFGPLVSLFSYLFRITPCYMLGSVDSLK